MAIAARAANWIACFGKEGVSRIEGAHCYAFYAGEEAFSALAEEEPGTFYLTDFLVRHFDALVIRGLGLDRYPELRDDYFGNYRRLVYLAQFDDPERRPRQGRRPKGSASPMSAVSPALRESAPSSTRRREKRRRRGQSDHPLLARHSEPGHRESGRSSAKRQLSERFIRAIDAAAMHAGAKSDDAYLAEWRRGEPIPCGDDLENEAQAAAERLEKEYDTHRLAVLAKHDGREGPP